MPLRMCRNVKWSVKCGWKDRVGQGKERRTYKGCNGAYENHPRCPGCAGGLLGGGSTSTIRARSTAITVWGVR